MHKRIPLAERFESKVLRTPSGCWRWMAFIAPHGYGRITDNRTSLYAHRVSYELYVGPIPDGLHLDHLCRHRWCVNPMHLDPVSPGENARRGIGHGSETRCPQGHPYAGDNLYIFRGESGNVRRQCRTCQKKHLANHRAKAKLST